jgi:beta-lactamase superfamily II metal-dependent hydrolase
MSNTAYDVLWPNDPNVLVRVAVLHVGQGNSAIVMAADGSSYKTLLVDINLDSKSDGIDVPKLVKDLLGGGDLDVFVNTHPHNDHLCGLSELSEEIDIQNVWHSGHNPGPNHCERYAELQALIKKVENAGGDVVELEGSRSSSLIGEVEYYVLSPAVHVKEEIGDEDPDARYQRIHEHCAVLKFGSGNHWIMLPGDADRQAWELHITKYHAAHGTVPATIFTAPHHGSRSFFRDNEEQEPYLDALKAINPEHIIISAPRSDESQWEHPHSDAVDLYADHVGEDNIFHTGKDRHSFICDVLRDGGVTVTSDEGKLSANYPYKKDGTGGDDDGDDTKSSVSKSSVFRSSAPAILGNDGKSG